MSITAGLVGLPNVGKSTLFNALTKSCVPAENYPFCTIDPHVAVSIVDDPRIAEMKEIYKTDKVVPAYVQFVDIAGLVKGAASGEGLGNQFLSHIREVDLILHVLRCFEDSLITHSSLDIDPLIDYEIIVTELMLKDLDSVIKRIAKVENLIKQAKSNPVQLKELVEEEKLLKKLKEALNDSNLNLVKNLILESSVVTVPLLSAKKFLILANLSEQEIGNEQYKNNKHYLSLKNKFGDLVIPVCARLEYELSQLDKKEAEEMANMMELAERGIDRIIRESFKHLDLISFFTCGPKEVHAWPIKNGLNIRQAAGKIHSDLERGFICADVYNYSDIIIHKTEAKLKELGKIRVEGQDYKVKDGDIVHIKFNV